MTDTSPTPPAGDRDTPRRSGEKRGGLGPVILVVALAIAISVATGSFPFVAVVLAIVAMVMLHELGHFLTAKWSGMKVTEFFFGFGPRLWTIRRGETEYGVKALPFGGYVKIVGMSNLERGIDPADEPRTYRQQPYRRRLAVAVAGTAMHFLIAFVLLMLVWTVVGVPQPTSTLGSISRLKTGESPAQQAGLQVGDKIVSVDGRPLRRWDDLPPYIRAHPGKPIALVVERQHRTIPITVVPAGVNPEGQPVGFVGIGPLVRAERVNPVVAGARAGRDVAVLTVGSAKALVSFFSPNSLRSYAGLLTSRGGSAHGEEGDTRFISLVGVVRIAGQAAQHGLFDVLYLLVLLNVFVGMFNMVPLLPLDGGHVAIATYERLRSRRGRRYHADAAKMMPVTAAVVVVLIVIGATSLWLDIVRPLSNPFQ